MDPEDRVFTEEEYTSVAARIDSLMPWQLAWNSTVALLVVQAQRLQAFGTGTLLKIADEHLLITATHVIEDANAQNLLLLRADMKRKEDVIPLEAEAILGERDGLDVAILRLRPQVVERLGDGVFLRLDHFCYEQSISDAMFAVMGFPAIMASHENGIVSITKFHHVAPAFEGDVSTLLGFDARTHFLVDAGLVGTRTVDGKQLEFRRKTGESAAFPKELGGISGGSVWKIADNPADTIKRQPNSGKMIGVATSVYSKSQCIKASRLSGAIRMLRDALPELRNPIDLWRGK